MRDIQGKYHVFSIGKDFRIDGEPRISGSSYEPISSCLAAVPTAMFIGLPVTPLVFGGSFGAVPRNLLRLNTVSKVDLVEPDPTAVELLRHDDSVRTLSEYVGTDSRITFYVEPVKEFVRRTTVGPYNLVIFDLPSDPTPYFRRIRHFFSPWDHVVLFRVPSKSDLEVSTWRFWKAVTGRRPMVIRWKGDVPGSAVIAGPRLFPSLAGIPDDVTLEDPRY